MDIKSVKQSLPFLMKNKIPAFLWGSQGIGKTKTVYQFCQEQGLGCVVLHTATQDVGDLIGLLVKGDDGTVHHARPEWFPTEGQGIVFLDELNRAATDVIQAMFPFVTEGRLHRHILPDGWYVMAAGNYNSDRFTVTDTSDAAWLSRFCHIDFTPSVEEWTVYADSRNLNSVADFIRSQPTCLELSSKDAGRLDTSFIVPDRRAWTEGIGRLEQELNLPVELQYELYAGLVGTPAAAAFISWKEKAEKGITLKQVLTKYEGKIRKRVQELSENPKDKKFSVLNQPVDELFVQIEGNAAFLDEKMVKNLKQFLLDIPKELAMKAFVKMSGMGNFSGRNELLNDPEYVKLYIK